MAPLLKRGLSTEDCVFRLDLIGKETEAGRLYRTDKRIEILADCTLTCPDRLIGLRKGEMIRMGFTYKYTLSQVTTFLERNRFHCLTEFVSDDGENVLILAQKCKH
jgi:hypothetical protein